MRPHQLNLILVFLFFLLFFLPYILLKNSEAILRLLKHDWVVYPGWLLLLGGYIKVAERQKNHYSICSKWFPCGGRFIQASEMNVGANNTQTPSSEIKVSGTCVVPGMNMKGSEVGVATKILAAGAKFNLLSSTLLLQGCSRWLSFESLGWGGCSKGNWERKSAKFPLIPEHKALRNLRTGNF